jgi:hypothetical protein
MPRQQSKGKCEFCSQLFAKGSMTRHLGSCAKRKARIAGPKTPRKSAKRILHLVVEGRYQPVYWLHLETRADSDFDALDGYLRDIWLECCGHLSEFTFREPASRRGQVSANPWDLFEQAADFDGPSHDNTMGDPIGKRVSKGDEFFYDYDFGSTTQLKLKVVGEREGSMKKHEVSLLSRNEPPEILCECGKPATEICTECSWEPDGWLCASCAKKHPCDEGMFLPVVNSPRTGVCGYTGC